VDGRQFDDVTPLRTPGGDFVEFLVLLSEFQKNEEALTQPIVDDLFYHYIDTPDNSDRRLQSDPIYRTRFYYHTDVEAVQKIQEALALQRTGNSTSSQLANGEQGEQGVSFDLSYPLVYLQDDIMNLLMEPDYHGCLHLRLIMTYPTLYDIDLGVTRMLIQSYFKLLWNRDKMGTRTGDLLYKRLKFVVAEGAHREIAWFNLRTNRKCWGEQIAPVFTFSLQAGADPYDDQVDQFFVNSNQAVVHLRRNLVDFLREVHPLLSSRSLTFFRVSRTARRAVLITKKFLLQSTPEYLVTVLP